jgi:hypothetical protein
MTQLLLTLLLLTQLPSGPSLSTKCSPKKLTVGDPFYVELKLTCSNSCRITGPLADSLGPFLILDQQLKTKSRQGYNDNTYRLKMAGFKAGEQALPRLVFLLSAGDRTDTLRSDSLKVKINSVLSPKMQDINDLKPEAKFPNYWLWLIPGLILVLAALVYLSLQLYKKLKRIKEQALAPLPPWEEALKALDKLPKDEWLARGLVSKYYYALSEVLKRYIERRFEFNAVEQTTTEIVLNLKIHKTPLRQEFSDFLNRADLVKYAKAVPPGQEVSQAMKTVRELIAKTIPAPQEPDGTAKGEKSAKEGR